MTTTQHSIHAQSDRQSHAVVGAAHRLIPDGECYTKMEKAVYGCDAFGNRVVVDDGYRLVAPNEPIVEGDRPFDVYAG